MTTKRRLLQTVPAAISLPVVGCLGGGTDPATASRTVTFDDTTATPGAPTGYDDRTLARRTPDPSVLGQPSLTAERRRGRATDRVTATRGGDRVAVADYTLDVYETALGADRENVTYDLYWLWTAARTTADGVALSETVNHVRLGDGADLTVYDVTDGDGASVARERTGTDDDEFAVRWDAGGAETAVATGHCVGRRSGDRSPVEWRLSLSVA